MTPIHDIQEQIEGIDLQILKLLADRVKLYRQADDGDTQEFDSDSVALWVEEATDSGLDESLAEKVCKLVILMGRKVDSE